jgi:DNA polymerase elongation subunit (family B)
MAIYVADERKALLSIELRLLILQYLVRIKEIPLAEKWTTEKELKNGEVEPQELVVSKTLSQDPSDYKVDNLTALAAQQLEDVGVRIHPGERVSYLIRDARSRVKEDRVRAVPLMGPEDGYDEEKYTGLLLKAAEELLIPFGYDMSVLSRWVDFSLKHEKGESLDSVYKNILG